MGDKNDVLARAANRFFIEWKKRLLFLLEQAKERKILRNGTDSEALTHLIMSTIEGAILICKASGDFQAFEKTTDTLMEVVYSHKEGGVPETGRAEMA